MNPGPEVPGRPWGRPGAVPHVRVGTDHRRRTGSALRRLQQVSGTDLWRGFDYSGSQHSTWPGLPELPNGQLGCGSQPGA